MARRVILHIGAPKSGTTFLQTLLWNNRERLRADGVLLPGRRLFDHNRASVAIRSGGATDDGRPAQSRLWARLRAQIADWEGTAVLSNEWLTKATARQAQAAVAALGPAHVDVIFTARDPVAQIPAGWQETLKTGSSATLDEFLHGLDQRDAKWQWDTLDPVAVLPRWESAHSIHVVTVPPRSAGPDLLWHRFAAVLGIDPTPYDIHAARSNESLSAEAAALMQRFGPLLRAAIDAEGGGWIEPYTWIRGYVAHQLLVPRRGSPLGLRQDQRDALRSRSLDSVQALAASSYRVVGNLDDLTAAQQAAGARRPEDVSDTELLGLALPVMVDIIQRLRSQVRQAEDEHSGATAAGQAGIR